MLGIQLSLRVPYKTPYVPLYFFINNGIFKIPPKNVGSTTDSRLALPVAGSHPLPFQSDTCYGSILTVSPSQVIEAFDECLEFVYGRRYGRDNPHRSDQQTAARWIDAGLTLPIACFVFHRQMNILHEKWLRDDLKDRSHIPHSLKPFDENIESAIRRHTQGDVTQWDIEESKWRSRIAGWLKKPSLWNQNMWGPSPDNLACRAPKALIREALDRAEAKRMTDVDSSEDERKKGFVQASVTV